MLGISIVLLSLILSVPTAFSTTPTPCELFGFVEDDFQRIDPEVDGYRGGFGDPMNNYAWSMAYLDGALYVGTVRNLPALVGMMSGLEEEIGIMTWPDGDPGSEEWANSWTPEIWRYKCGEDPEWTMVYRPEITITPPNPLLPAGIPMSQTMGYRCMTTFKDAVYAGAGIFAFPPIGEPFPHLILRSENGFDWEPVPTLPILLSESLDIRAMAAHDAAGENKLYVAGMGGVIFSSEDPTTGAWDPVCEPYFGLTFPFDTLAEIPELCSFNDRLYAGTYNIFTGYQVWRSKIPHPMIQDDWEKIVDGGYGDTWNQGAITMEVFNDHLYVGSALWFDYYPPMPDMGDLAKGPKGFELIRIDTEDNVELIIGAYNPTDPLPLPLSAPIPRPPPMSGWPAGFGNILQPYCWSLEEHDGWLYLGTLDLSSVLGIITPEMISSLPIEDMLPLIAEELLQSGLDEQYVIELLALLEDVDPAEIIHLLWEYLGGADMWKSADGIYWIPVSLNGFDHPFNYGFRTMVSTPEGLYVGTANPFREEYDGGCQVWVGSCELGTVKACDGYGIPQDEFNPGDEVYVKGCGFRPCDDVDIYIFPNGDYPEDDPLPGVEARTNEDGKLPITKVWDHALPGRYDIWVDVNQNGEYDERCDVWEVRCMDIHSFFVIPEMPFGTLLAVMATMAALAVSVFSKRKSQGYSIL